jgi:hypothetical protein
MATNYLTNLRLALSPINPAFMGDPQSYAEELVRKLRIVAPFGTGLFVEGAIEPSSNQGPWLKDGTQWWVWDNEEKRYVPIDITASLPAIFYMQDTEPSTTQAAEDGTFIWFRTNANRIAGMYVLVNGAWDPITLTSGTTAERPASPRPFQEFYDTDISALIWFERGQWRTKDGVRGDVKHVTFETGEEALRSNPGWDILGTGDLVGTQYRGRTIVAATKDKTGTTPTAPTDLDTGGLAAREAMTVGGGETASVTMTEANMPRHQHEFGMEDKATPIGALEEDPDAVLGDPGAGGGIAGDGSNRFATEIAGSDPQRIGVTRFRGKEEPDAISVSLIQPSLFLFALRKA